MTTIQLKAVTLEVTSVNLANQFQSPAIAGEAAAADVKVLNVSANLKVNGNTITSLFKTYVLEGDDLKVTLDAIEALGVAKITAEISA